MTKSLLSYQYEVSEVWTFIFTFSLHNAFAQYSYCMHSVCYFYYLHKYHVITYLHVNRYIYVQAVCEIHIYLAPYNCSIMKWYVYSIVTQHLYNCALVHSLHISAGLSGLCPNDVNLMPICKSYIRCHIIFCNFTYLEQIYWILFRWIKYQDTIFPV